MTNNSLTPPQSNLESNQDERIAPALWNPEAAASWSLFLSPIFGSFLHMKNWEALGETQKASIARSWLFANLAFYIVIPIIDIAFPSLLDHLPNSFLGFVILFAWYFSSGKSQVIYVQDKFGGQYPRKSWSKPIGLAVIALVGYLIAVAMIGIIFLT